MKKVNIFSMREQHRKTRCELIYIVLTILILATPAGAWSNGGYSTDINNPKRGTHDLIVESAINMLPSDMKNKIDIKAADYGSEIPDCKNNTYCIGDIVKHSVYYFANGNVQKDDGATRAQEEYNLAESCLKSGDTYNFSLHLGAMSHYIGDVSVFGHTMSNDTNWGPETHHSDYERYVEKNDSNFFGGIYFDKTFGDISAYDATLNMAKETTFNSDVYTNVWMDDSYNWEDTNYVSRTKSLINYDVNLVADVIYKLLSSSPEGDMLAYYRGLGQYPDIVETNDLLKAADDWRNNVIPPGFSVLIATDQLLVLADEWRAS